MTYFRLWIDDEYAEQLRTALDDLGQYGGRITTTWHADSSGTLLLSSSPVVVVPRALSVSLESPQVSAPMMDPVYGTVVPGWTFIMRSRGRDEEKVFANLEQLTEYVHSLPKA